MNGQQEYLQPNVQHSVTVTVPRLTAGNLRALLQAPAIPDDAALTIQPLGQRDGSGWTVSATWSTS